MQNFKHGQMGQMGQKTSGDVTDPSFQRAVRKNDLYNCEYVFSDIGIGGDDVKESEQMNLVNELFSIIKKSPLIGTCRSGSNKSL